MGCSSKIEETGIGKEWQDLSGWPQITLQDLIGKISTQMNECVRIYTVKTTRLIIESNEIHHIGCGPNLEGGLATLCTCKHSMRQSHTCRDWKDKWILGLTSRAKNNGFDGTHYLFYLMKIKNAFENHRDLYGFLKNNNENNALRIKSSVNNPRGDIYIPKSNCNDLLDPNEYEKPCENHSHIDNNGWHDDIIGKNNSATLLMGDKSNTFVWLKPTIKFNKNRGPGNLILSMEEFIGCLS